MVTKVLSPNDIHIDAQGRVVINDPGMAAAVSKALKETGGIELVGPPVVPKPQPAPNMCGCALNPKPQAASK